MSDDIRKFLFGTRVGGGLFAIWGVRGLGLGRWMRFGLISLCMYVLRTYLSSSGTKAENSLKEFVCGVFVTPGLQCEEKTLTWRNYLLF